VKVAYTDPRPGLPLKWVVYLATDMETGNARYVGITSNLRRRTLAHISDSESAIRAATEDGAKLQMFPIAEFDDEGSARFLEHALITSIPGLLNRDIAVHKNRLANDDARKREAWASMTHAERYAAWGS
jgi:predicted GIY-YIG superfamily endonuclease